MKYKLIQKGRLFLKWKLDFQNVTFDSINTCSNSDTGLLENISTFHSHIAAAYCLSSANIILPMAALWIVLLNWDGWKLSVRAFVRFFYFLFCPFYFLLFFFLSLFSLFSSFPFVFFFLFFFLSFFLLSFSFVSFISVKTKSVRALVGFFCFLLFFFFFLIFSLLSSSFLFLSLLSFSFIFFPSLPSLFPSPFFSVYFSLSFSLRLITNMICNSSPEITVYAEMKR